MKNQEMMIINWVLSRLEKEGLISKNIADMTLHRYKKQYIQAVNETEDNDYRKAA